MSEICPVGGGGVFLDRNEAWRCAVRNGPNCNVETRDIWRCSTRNGSCYYTVTCGQRETFDQNWFDSLAKRLRQFFK